jgi:hypothetical protein
MRYAATTTPIGLFVSLRAFPHWFEKNISASRLAASSLAVDRTGIQLPSMRGRCVQCTGVSAGLDKFRSILGIGFGPKGVCGIANSIQVLVGLPVIGFGCRPRRRVV